MKPTEHHFFNDLKKKLWTDVDKLGATMDAAVYKQAVLGLVFLKYVSAASQDEQNAFCVPLEARWQTLRDCAELPAKPAAPGNNNLGSLIDNAMAAIARENATKLKNVLNKDFAYAQIDTHKLTKLIALFSDSNFNGKTHKGQPIKLKSQDILGSLYDHFLEQFALAEGKQSGQHHTPKCIVTLIVEMLQPHKGRVYDPAMGTGSFLVESAEWLKRHASSGPISHYGQENNPTAWRLAAMNLAIHGIHANIGSPPQDTLPNPDLHPDLRADYAMASPPLGHKPFAWLQHMLDRLGPAGSMAILLANGSMSSTAKGQGNIRKQLIEDDLVECVVALPGQLLSNTQIPTCIWFLSRDKTHGSKPSPKKRDRRGQVLLIDARSLGHMQTRVQRDFTAEDIKKIADTFHAWQHGNNPSNVPGFCYSASLEDIRNHHHVLHPGLYVGLPPQHETSEAFADNMASLTLQLGELFEENARLEAELKKNLAELGFPLNSKVSHD